MKENWKRNQTISELTAASAGLKFDGRHLCFAALLNRLSRKRAFGAGVGGAHVGDSGDSSHAHKENDAQNREHSAAL